MAAATAARDAADAMAAAAAAAVAAAAEASLEGGPRQLRAQPWEGPRLTL